MRSLQVRGIDRRGIIESVKEFQTGGNTEAREMGLLRSWLGEGQSGNVILGTRELGEMKSEE